jgi:hypothetical protein
VQAAASLRALTVCISLNARKCPELMLWRPMFWVLETGEPESLILAQNERWRHA